MITIFLLFIIITYLIIIGLLVLGFEKIETFKLQDLPAKTKFSVVIPFRNEAENLPKLLNSITRLNYPKNLFEVILVDDESEDESVAIIERIISEIPFDVIYAERQPVLRAGSRSTKGNIRIIKNNRSSNSPKKDAISYAIKTSKHNWIVTTDADCVLPKYWLDAFDECIQTQQPNCIVAPVTYHGKTSLLNRFQTLDFLSLQGATIGGFGIKKPLMCNGANFGYRKSEFISVNGFHGNENIASGDDIFLLEKFLKHDAENVYYLKSEQAIVTTSPAKNINTLIQQRLRWASKSSNLTGWFSKLVGLVVLFGNLTCLLLIPAVYFNVIYLKIAIALFVIKFSIDFLLLFKASRFFKQDYVLFSYLFSSIVYPFFSVGVAFFSFFKSYEWKGRKFEK